jgi:hypothetical protein
MFIQKMQFIIIQYFSQWNYKEMVKKEFILAFQQHSFHILEIVVLSPQIQILHACVVYILWPENLLKYWVYVLEIKQSNSSVNCSFNTFV